MLPSEQQAHLKRSKERRKLFFEGLLRRSFLCFSLLPGTDLVYFVQLLSDGDLPLRSERSSAHREWPRGQISCAAFLGFMFLGDEEGLWAVSWQKHDAIARLSRLHDIHGSIYKLWLACKSPHKL